MSAAGAPDLVGQIYEGVLEDPPWSGFLSGIRGALKAAVANLILQSPRVLRPEIMFESGGTPALSQLYRRRLWLIDPFVNLPLGQVITLDEFLDVEAFRAGDLFKLEMAPTGLFFILGVDLAIPDGPKARLRITRHQDLGNFTAEERSICQALVPHLERALRLFTRIAAVDGERLLYARTFDRLAIGTIVVDPEARILETNPVADALLGERDGLISRQGRLSTDSTELTRRLVDRIREAAMVETGGPVVAVRPLRIERSDGRMPLGLVVKPASKPDFVEAPVRRSAVVFVTDPERQAEGTAEDLSQFLGLSAAEGALALLLAHGLSLDEAAEELHVKRNTARAQLRSIFSKTGIGRQSELVRLVLHSAATLTR